MTSGRDVAGLFIDPTISGLVNEQAITCSEAITAAVGISCLEIEVLSGTVEPALRALRMAGYKPLAMDIVDARVTPYKIARLNFDAELTVSEADPAPDLAWMDNALDQVFYNVVLYAVPYTSDEDGQGTSYAMTLPLSGDGWRLEAGRAQDDNINSISIHLYVDQPDALAHPDMTILIAARPVDNFRFDMSNFLATVWSEVPWPSGETLPQVPSQPLGLLWLLEPGNWYLGATYDNNDHARALQKVGRDALLRADANVSDIASYLDSLLRGIWTTRETLKTVTGQPLRAFFRSGEFRRAFVRWFDSETAPFAPLPHAFRATARRLPWFDLICYLVEAKILQPPDLPLGALPDFEFEDLQFETVIARRPDDDSYLLELYMLGASGHSLDDPYGKIARIEALTFPHIDPDLLYVGPNLLYTDPNLPTPDPTPLSAHPFEQMFSWEYIPVETEMDANGNETIVLDANGQEPLPLLLVVAGPGVTVSEIHGQAIKVKVLRKSDYAIPPWGDRIDEAQLYRPTFVPAYTMNNRTEDFSHAGCLIVEKHNGITFNFYPYLTISHETGFPIEFPAEPHAKTDITLASTASGNVTYRTDFDFVHRLDGLGSYEGEPVLRIWRSGSDVSVKASVSTGVDMTIQIFDQPDIYKMHGHFPHMLPVADTLEHALINTGVPDDYMEVDQTLDRLPVITEAQIAQAGLQVVPAVTDAAASGDNDTAIHKT